MLVECPPIFVADTKIIDGYNFVTPLSLIRLKKSFKTASSSFLLYTFEIGINLNFCLKVYIRLWYINGGLT